MWNAIVDVADVCHSEELYPIGAKGPFPARLDAVVSAWRARHGADVRVELVVAKALLPALDAADRSELSRRAARGEVTVRAVADTFLLERAEAEGLHVLSGDHFLDFRVRHPWIRSHPERFHHWHQDEHGVHFVPRGIDPGPPRPLAPEDVEGLDGSARPHPGPEILNTRWRCAEPRCPYARTWTGLIPVWPRVDVDARALCPECAGVLAAQGPRRATRQVELADHATGESIERLPLELGINLVLGRGRIANGYNLGTRQRRFGEAVRYISRQHVLLRFATGRAGERVLAVDLGSANGTEIERWNGAGHEPGRPLAVDVEEMLAPRDRLVLGGGVRVEVGAHDLDPKAPPRDVEHTEHVARRTVPRG